MKDQVTKKSWDEFRKSGLLFLINQLLHFFGWDIVFEIENYGTDKEVTTNIYPARVTFRGFTSDCSDIGYKQVQDYLKNNIDDLEDDFK